MKVKEAPMIGILWSKIIQELLSVISLMALSVVRGSMGTETNRTSTVHDGVAVP